MKRAHVYLNGHRLGAVEIEDWPMGGPSGARVVPKYPAEVAVVFTDDESYGCESHLVGASKGIVQP